MFRSGVYQVKLIHQVRGLDRTVAVPDNEFIPDLVEDLGIRLPLGCQTGNCLAGVARLLVGEVDLREQKFLSLSEVEAG